MSVETTVTDLQKMLLEAARLTGNILDEDLIEVYRLRLLPLATLDWIDSDQNRNATTGVPEWTTLETIIASETYHDSRSPHPEKRKLERASKALMTLAVWMHTALMDFGTAKLIPNNEHRSPFLSGSGYGKNPDWTRENLLIQNIVSDVGEERWIYVEKATEFVQGLMKLYGELSQPLYEGDLENLPVRLTTHAAQMRNRVDTLSQELDHFLEHEAKFAFGVKVNPETAEYTIQDFPIDTYAVLQQWNTFVAKTFPA